MVVAVRIERGEDRQIQQVTVWFIDFGNTEVITDMKLIRKMDLPLIQKYPKLIATPGQVSIRSRILQWFGGSDRRI